jgi:DNA-binding IclR family transcriptional regulator
LAAPQTGTQSVARALRLLKELSSHGEFGWRLCDLARQLDIDHGTCHRLLTCFVKEGFAERRSGDLKYYPGQVLFEMGLAVPRFADLGRQVEARLERLSTRTGCVASFSLRSDYDVVCAFQKQVHPKISGMLLRVGSRRPMITTVGGLAILQQLPRRERDQVVDENTRRERARSGARRVQNLERMRRRSDERGFGFMIGDIAPGLVAVAVAVRDPGGLPYAAMTLTGNDAVLNDSNVASFHAMLVEASALDTP